MIDEKRQDFVQVNKNVQSIASSEQYLKYIKKYLNKLQPNQISTIYNNLNFNNPQLLQSKYTTVNNESDITNYNIYSKSVIEHMNYINNIYDGILNSKLLNSGLNKFTNCEITNFVSFNAMYSTKYLDLYDMQQKNTLEQTIYPLSVLVLKKSEICLQYPTSFGNIHPLSGIYSDEIQLKYNEQYIYHLSFIYKTTILMSSAFKFLIRIFTAETDTSPLTFDKYINVPTSIDYTTFSTIFSPSPLVDTPQKANIKIAFYLNNTAQLNDDIILHLVSPMVWWQNI